MAWLVGDGFDFYSVSADAATNLAVWQSVSQSVVQAGGRFSSGRYMLLGNLSLTGGNMLTAAFANSTTIYVSANIMSSFPHTNGGTTALVGFSWMDGTNRQGGLFLRDGGDFIVTNGLPGGTILATSTVLFPVASAWHHIEVKIVVNNTTGTVEIRIDGRLTDDFSSGSINTRNGSANNYANVINWLGHDGGSDNFDDFYCFNDQGGAPNTWQGDVRAVQQMPNTDQSITWTRNGGTNNCLRVSELVQDGDTTYVYTAVVNNVDTYGLAALATTPNSIIAVVPRYMVRMDDVGPHTVTAQLTSAGTTVTLPNYNPSNTYVYQQAVYTLDPNTSAAWSAAAVNALLLSIKDIL